MTVSKMYTDCCHKFYDEIFIPLERYVSACCVDEPEILADFKETCKKVNRDDLCFWYLAGGECPSVAEFFQDNNLPVGAWGSVELSDELVVLWKRFLEWSKAVFIPFLLEDFSAAYEEFSSCDWIEDLILSQHPLNITVFVRQFGCVGSGVGGYKEFLAKDGYSLVKKEMRILYPNTVSRRDIYTNQLRWFLESRAYSGIASLWRVLMGLLEPRIKKYKWIRGSFDPVGWYLSPYRQVLGGRCHGIDVLIDLWVFDRYKNWE
jgi:hypothetical protein